MGYYHWFLFAQPHPLPETLINAAPEAWFTAHTSREPKPSTFFHPEALADYLAAARKPEMIRGMCEDYRAAATHRSGARPRQPRRRRRRCNARCWCCGAPRARSASGTMPLAIWREYCSGPVTGGAIDSGHYLAEEAPQAVVERIPRVLLVTSSSPTAERLSFVCNACQLDTGTVVPNTPSWATLWGFSGCIRWLVEPPTADVDARSPLCLPEAPAAGAEHWLAVGKPFHAALEQDIWCLYQPPLSYYNGWDDRPDELVRSALARCKVLALRDVRTHSAIVHVRVRR